MSRSWRQALAGAQRSIDTMFDDVNGGSVAGVDYAGPERGFTPEGMETFVEACLYMQQQLAANERQAQRHQRQSRSGGGPGQ